MKTKLSNKLTGFSLVELMVAITISVVLLTGLIQVYMSAKRSYLIQDSIARMQENGRYAVNLLNRDLRLAGYMGGNADVSTLGGSRAPVTPDGQCGGTNDTRWGRMVARSVFAINVAPGNTLTGYNCISPAGNPAQRGQHLSGDILSIRYFKHTNLNAASRANNAGLYLKTSLTSGQVELVNKDVNIDSFFAPNSGQPISYNKLESYTYYSGHQNADCDGIATQVPTLFRMALSNDGTPKREELIRGVENLQVQFGVDSNSDGALDQYQNADTITNWALVRSVRLWLLIRAECPGAGGYLNNNTYTMGDANLTPNDRFRRQLYTSTVMLRNNEVI
ncbi:MAG: PilW family protein [Thiotrichales bacterium]|nr:PilW family protein [Thiotrichales bacterium]